MKTLKPEKITKILDAAFDAVEASKLGPVFQNKQTNLVNIVAYNAMMAVIQSQLPSRSIAKIEEPGDAWRQDPDSDQDEQP